MGGWANLTLVTDDDLGALEPQARANQTPYPWGAITWASQRTEAKRELKIWIEAAFPEVKGAADRILDRHAADYVFSLIGTTYADITSAAENDEEEDVALATIFATPGTNRIYVGAAYQFEGLYVTLLDSLNAVASVLTVKYWNGSAFVSASATDGTANGVATFAQTGRVTWTIPSSWGPRRFNGTADEYFWIELSVSAALTAGTLASQLLPIRAPDGLKRIATLLALHFITNGLAQQSANREEWIERAGYYWQRAEKLWAELKEKGGIPLDLNKDQVVSLGEIQPTQPLRLRRG